MVFAWFFCEVDNNKLQIYAFNELYLLTAVF